MNFLDGFFWGEGLRPPSSMGIKCPFCLRQLDFWVLGAPQVDGHYLSQRLFFCRVIFCLCFFLGFWWIFGGQVLFGGVVFICFRRTLTKLPMYVPFFFSFGCFILFLKF